MQRTALDLLAVWREVSRDIEIPESAAKIAELLARHVPLGQLIVRRLDTTARMLLTVATAAVLSPRSIAQDRRDLRAAELAKIVRWFRDGQPLRRGARGGVIDLVVPPEIEADVLAAPLAIDGEPIGVLLLVAADEQRFDDAHGKLLDALREPLAVALQNDRRIHEMARLRAAAEADRGTLLRRLGRTDLTDTIVGEDSGLRHVIERIELVSKSDVPVLVLGETGTGKELVARAIHIRSARSAGPFIRVNCGAIPAELIDSQLFGHERGSFTGADQARQGWFERADGGTLFLDEIGELPLEAQVRFLRVLQDGFVERVGGAHPIHVEVRIVAATHRDLAQMVRAGTFREDLWYRLAVFPILLPPLRERRDDIPALAHHLAERAAVRFCLPRCEPTVDDIRLLQSYDWPGNIRELGAVIDRAAILGNGTRLDVLKALGWSQVGGNASLSRSGPVAPSQPTPKESGAVLSLDEAMRSHIESVLKRTQGRIEGRQGAAALLRINPHTLRARMRKLKIDWSRYRTADGD
jgi:transcriptional regulator with GAF, ATPase, and Fis domain